MVPALSEKETAAVRARLARRRNELIEEIRNELLESDNQHYTDLAERVHDVAEESVADLLSDLGLAVIDRHISELRDIEDAQQRMARAWTAENPSIRNDFQRIQRPNAVSKIRSATKKPTPEVHSRNCKSATRGLGTGWITRTWDPVSISLASEHVRRPPCRHTNQPRRTRPRGTAMQLPLEITFRNMDASDAMESNVRERAEKLDQYYDQIMSCRVAVEAHHRHHHKGNIYSVRIDITVPDDELVVSREPGRDHAHEDVYVAIRDAFDAARRQLKEYAEKRRREVKTHEAPPHGQIGQLVPDQDYGNIVTSDGREVYFHRNSVLNSRFEELEVGMEVRFEEEQGEKGPQASSVHVIGKHHIAG
jgi:ribosomal subunit interface protein